MSLVFLGMINDNHDEHSVSHQHVHKCLFSYCVDDKWSPPSFKQCLTDCILTERQPGVNWWHVGPSWWTHGVPPEMNYLVFECESEVLNKSFASPDAMLHLLFPTQQQCLKGFFLRIASNQTWETLSHFSFTPLNRHAKVHVGLLSQNINYY